MDGASAAREDTSNGSGPPPRRRRARRGMWSATLHAVAHRSPLLTPAHVVEGVAGVAVVGWAALHGLVLVLGAPAAGDAAAARAASHRADVVLVEARTETVTEPTARGYDPGSRGATRVRVRYDRDGVEVDRVVTAGELTAARAGAGTASPTRIWIDAEDGTVARASQAPEEARLLAVLQRSVEVCVVLAGAVLASRLVTWTALRLRGRRWARDWRVWDDRRDPAAPGHG